MLQEEKSGSTVSRFGMLQEEKSGSTVSRFGILHEEESGSTVADLSFPDAATEACPGE
jgi:hypothetical protein